MLTSQIRMAPSAARTEIGARTKIAVGARIGGTAAEPTTDGGRWSVARAIAASRISLAD